MPCYTPIGAYWAEGGRVVFNSKEGYSDRPFSLPCGKCPGCREEKARQWALRIVHESKLHPQSSFVTLTYRQHELPAGETLQIEDLQKFFKRLRRTGRKVRYFACGEYGDENLRPHYHICLFNEDFSSDRVLYSTRNGNKLYVSPLLEKVWGKGFAPVGELTFESAQYVARYSLKKCDERSAEERYMRRSLDTGETYQVKPEFVTMSRKPGIGAGWFKKFSEDVFPSDEVIHRGRKYRPPRFYEQFVDEDELVVIKGKRRRRMEERAEANSPDSLKTRLRVHKLKMADRKLRGSR